MFRRNFAPFLPVGTLSNQWTFLQNFQTPKKLESKKPFVR